MKAVSSLKTFCRLALSGLFVMCAAPSFAADPRAIPADNLAYPVLITLQNRDTGSGFYVNNGKYLYLVTAKHVLFDQNTQKLFACSLDQAQESAACGATLLSYSEDPVTAGLKVVQNCRSESRGRMSRAGR